jgi:uncharacterized damage-inducible protein DinB
MKKYNSTDLLNELQADVRALLAKVAELKTEDPGILLQQPAPGKWSVIQVLEHLNSYGNYYLRALEKALAQDKPAVEFFKPGWLGNYFTKIMKPNEKGIVTNKMQTPKGHKPTAKPDAFPTIQTFCSQQLYLLQLLEQAKEKNIGKIRVPISLTRFIKMKAGDTFRFFIAHEQRHFVQIANALQTIKGRPLVYSMA